MKLNSKLGGLLLGSIALSVGASDDGLMISMKIERNGQTVSTPRIWSQYGKDSAVQVGNSFRIELKANDLGTSADLNMKLYANETGTLQLVSAPRIHASFSAESAVQVTSKDGAVYKVTITPVRAAQPI